MPATLGPNVTITCIRDQRLSSVRPVTTPARQRATKVNIGSVNLPHGVVKTECNEENVWKRTNCETVHRRGTSSRAGFHIPGQSDVTERKPFWIRREGLKSAPATRAASAPGNVAYMDKHGTVTLRRTLSRPQTAHYRKQPGDLKLANCESGIATDDDISNTYIDGKLLNKAWLERTADCGTNSKAEPRVGWSESESVSKDNETSDGLVGTTEHILAEEENDNTTSTDTEHKETPDENTGADNAGNRELLAISGRERSLDRLKLLRASSRRRKRRIEDQQYVIAVPDEDIVVQESHSEVKCHFLRYIRYVCRVVRLLSAMIETSSGMTSRSATEEQYHALNTSLEVKSMVFNKGAFEKGKVVTQFPKWAVEIVEKDPETRNTFELRRLHALLRSLRSFNRFTEKIQLSMCRAFSYHKVQSGRIILRQGHVGVNFYFLFTGSVFVNVNDTDGHGNQFVKTEVVLKRGDSFGELALLQDIRRTATISCREDCELLVVDKYTFAKVCPRIFELELEEKMRFLSKLDIFSPKFWSKESLKKLCSEAQIQEYKTNKVVVEDSTADDWLYVCMEGKCEVLRRLDLDEEIAYRRDQQHLLCGDHGNDAEINHVLGHMAHSYVANCEDDVLSHVTNLEVGREGLLDSMGLEYTKVRKLSVDDIQLILQLQRKQRAASHHDNRRHKQLHPGIPRPLTLTSLLAHEEKEKRSSQRNVLYLNIKTVKSNDIFDVYSLVNPADRLTTGSYLLVSTGAKVVRLKRSSLLKTATEDAMELIRAVADKGRYPSDNVLLRNYCDFLDWELYKASLLHAAVRPATATKPARLSNLVKVMASKMEESNDRKRSLLAELRKVLAREVDIVTKIPIWEQDVELSSKSHLESGSSSLKPKVQASPEEDASRRDDNAHAHFLTLRQRRSSVASGLLRQVGVTFLDKRRYSQPLGTREFAIIEEMEDLLSPIFHEQS